MIDLPEDDDQLAAELGNLLRRHDPVPADVIESARGALAWRTVDADIAVLASDSYLTAAAGVRGTGGDRQLTFAGATVTLEVDVLPDLDDHGGYRLVGQVVPAYVGEIEIERRGAAAGGKLSAVTDKYGQFAVAFAPSGPTRLRFRPADAERVASIVTDWVTL